MITLNLKRLAVGTILILLLNSLNAMPVRNPFASNSIVSKVSIDNAFEFTVECFDKKSKCKNLRKALDRVGQRIAKVLIISRKIKVHARLINFEKSGDPRLVSTADYRLAAAAPSVTKLARVKGTKEWSLYPISSIKQNVYTTSTKMYDIDIFFNTKMDLYFGGDAVIQPNELDVEYIAVHELCHGLGISTNFYVIEAAVNVEGSITPKFMNDGNWAPLNILDTLIESNGHSFASYHHELTKFKSKISDPKLKRAELLKSPLGIYAHSSYEFIKSAHIKTNYGDFYLDMSLSHFKDDYIIDSNAKYIGLTIDQILEKNSRKEIYSEKLLSVFSRMGYETILGNPPIKLELKRREFKANIVMRAYNKLGQGEDASLRHEASRTAKDLMRADRLHQ